MSTLVNLQYGYDRASNRKHRLDEAATANSQHFDERYTYDGLNRLTAFDRGQLDVNGNNLTNATLGQTWTLDPTGNWNAFAQSVTGAFSTTRTHTEANEIEGIATPTGSPTWATPPVYDYSGNMTEFPQPGSLGSSYVATYDAWNRLVKLENGGTVAEYEYDGLNRRTTKTVASETRHAYFSDRWQVLEERVDSSTDADRQFLWGERYVDDLVLRDRDTTGNGTLDERLYALCDALFNVVALTDDTGDVKERFAYQPYGKSEPLDPDFTTYSGTDYEWEYRFTGRELDLESGLQINRNRYLHLELGRWLTRDPLNYQSGLNLYRYARSQPTKRVDAVGTTDNCCCCCVKSTEIVPRGNSGGYNHLGTGFNELVGEYEMWGHSFDFRAHLENVKSDKKGKCSIRWFECGDSVPADYRDAGAKPGQWFDASELIGVSDTLSDWREYGSDGKSTPCPGAFTLVANDTPMIPRNSSRTLKFALRIESAPGCPCAYSAITVYSIQTLVARPILDGDREEVWTFEPAIDPDVALVREPKSCGKIPPNREPNRPSCRGGVCGSFS